MDAVVNGLAITAAGVALILVGRVISKRRERRVQGWESVVATVVDKETHWTDGGGRHVIYVGNAPEGIEVDAKAFEVIRRGDEVQVFKHPRTGELVHLSSDHESSFIFLVFGWLIAGLGSVLAVINLIRLLAE